MGDEHGDDKARAGDEPRKDKARIASDAGKTETTSKSDDVTAEIPVTADATVELPTTGSPADAEPRWSSSPMFVFTLAAAIGLLLGLAIANLPASGVGGTVVASEHVGPEGATLALSTGGTVVIPADALERSMRITVTAGRIPGGRTAYIFSPSLSFSQPVRITLPTNDPAAIVVSSRRGHLSTLEGEIADGGFTFEVSDFRFE